MSKLKSQRSSCWLSIELQNLVRRHCFADSTVFQRTCKINTWPSVVIYDSPRTFFVMEGLLLTLTSWTNASFSRSILVIRHKLLTSSSVMKYPSEFLDICCIFCLMQVQVCVSHCKLQWTGSFSDLVQVVLGWGHFRPEVFPRLHSPETTSCRL